MTYEPRIFLFLIGCIGIRTFFVYLAKNINENKLPFIGYLALIPAIGFAYIYLSGSRKTGFEANGIIWWNHLRPIHSLLYFLFAFSAILKYKNKAWQFLAIDVLIGLVAFINHHIIRI